MFYDGTGGGVKLIMIRFWPKKIAKIAKECAGKNISSVICRKSQQFGLPLDPSNIGFNAKNRRGGGVKHPLPSLVGLNNTIQ